MHQMKVGGMFAAGVTSFPEMSHYAWDPIGHAPLAHHRLVTFAAGPTAQERAAFARGGRVEFALLAEGPAVVLLWAGAGWPWSDAPYAWQLQAAVHQKAGRGELPVPDVSLLPPGAGAPLDMILVDAATGKIVALRTVALPGDFVIELHRAIASQAAAPWDERAYDAKLKALSAEDCDALVVRAGARCKIGGGA